MITVHYLVGLAAVFFQLVALVFLIRAMMNLIKIKKMLDKYK